MYRQISRLPNTTKTHTDNPVYPHPCREKKKSSHFSDPHELRLAQMHTPRQTYPALPRAVFCFFNTGVPKCSGWDRGRLSRVWKELFKHITQKLLLGLHSQQFLNMYSPTLTAFQVQPCVTRWSSQTVLSHTHFFVPVYIIHSWQFSVCLQMCDEKWTSKVINYMLWTLILKLFDIIK